MIRETYSINYHLNQGKQLLAKQVCATSADHGWTQLTGAIESFLDVDKQPMCHGEGVQFDKPPVLAMKAERHERRYIAGLH